jgi:ABC-2 type transport system ATP-binding protein
MLELDDLHRRFGDVVALDGMTFTVEAGKVAGFLGPNGAGKTTAMRAVLGVTALDSGGRSRGDVPDRCRRDRIEPASRGGDRRCARRRSVDGARLRASLHRVRRRRLADHARV